MRPAFGGSCACAKMVEERVRVVRCGGSLLNFRRAVFSADSKYVGVLGRQGAAGRGGDWRPSASLGSVCPDPGIPGQPGLAAAWVSLGYPDPACREIGVQGLDLL